VQILLFVYIYCHWVSNYKEGKVGISITGLTLSRLCACPRT